MTGGHTAALPSTLSSPFQAAADGLIHFFDRLFDTRVLRGHHYRSIFELAGFRRDHYFWLLPLAVLHNPQKSEFNILTLYVRLPVLPTANRIHLRVAVRPGNCDLNANNSFLVPFLPVGSRLLPGN